jgi:hypothetical protein
LLKAASLQVKQTMHKYNKNVDPQLISLLTLSISKWRTTTKPIKPGFLSNEYTTLCNHQSEIGWNQVLCCCLSKEWHSVLQLNYQLAGQWLSYAIWTLWKAFYVVWKAQCSHNHGISKEAQDKCALLTLTPKVQEIFKHQDTHPESQYLFHNTLEETHLLPTATLRVNGFANGTAPT